LLRRVSRLNSFGETDVLSARECSEVAGTVLDLRESWTSRSPSGLFFTLGVNSYMDLAHAAHPNVSYFEPARRCNAVLKQHFSSTYGRLRQVLEGDLGLPTRFDDDLAMPGFHIWLGLGVPHTSGASIHFDLQYERLLSRPQYANASGTMSFTLPIRMPAGGSSLKIWPDCSYPEDVPRVVAARRAEAEVLEYHVGSAVVHTGHVLHQIGGTPSVQPDDVRITLQGHGLVVDGALVLYW
jgi:hypothetical protein